MHSFDPLNERLSIYVECCTGADINMEILTLHQGGSTVHTLNARLLGLDTWIHAATQY